MENERNNMELEPLGDLVVVQLEEESKEKKSESGFLFQAPKWAKPQNIATVLSKSAAVSSVAEGEKVLVNPYAFIDTEDTLVKLIREKDILCRIKISQ